MSIKKNNLGYENNLFLFQDKKMFRYSVDTILLGNFATIKRSTKKCLDIGTNNAALAIFVAKRYQELKIDAIEIQNSACLIARKNIVLNQLEEQIKIISADVREFAKTQKQLDSHQKYDLIICNPPFYKVDVHKTKNHSKAYLQATHEITLTLEEMVSSAKMLIKQKGYLALVYATERLVDLLCALRKYHFEPKRIQFIHPRVHQKSNLVLVEARYQSGWGTFFLPNIYLHPADVNRHEYTGQIRELYKPINIIKAYEKK